MAVAGLRSTVRLNSGVRIPMLGLGCMKAEPGQTEAAVAAALETGYRLIDTASVYENEEEVGRAVRASAIPRADLFVSTKVWNSDQGYDRTLQAFDRSLTQLNLQYIDLYLLHWPLIRLRKESWKALVRLVREGRCRTVGVCNFAVRHLSEIIEESGVVPAVNQVEFNPFLNQGRLHEWCRQRDILLQTNRPFPRPRRLRDRRLADMAGRYDVSVNRLLVRWALQKSVSVLVRSSDPDLIAECADAFRFEIAPRDMEALESMNENLRVGWDPTNAP